MLHIFKLNGHRVAYDCATRTCYPLSALAMKIIETVTPPLSPECPSSLRYSLAKYDSRDLSDAYAEVYRLAEAGLLFSNKNENAETPEPGETYAVIESSPDAVKRKIESAVAAGFTAMIVTVKDACPCLASSLTEAYKEQLHLRLILEIAPDLLSDADIAALNRHGCYVRVPNTAAALALASRGAQFVDADIPATESGIKEAGKLEKEMERRAKAGNGFHFATFDHALLKKEGFDSGKATCADCWAHEICGGFRLGSSGERTPLCDLECAAIECATILESEAEL